MFVLTFLKYFMNTMHHVCPFVFLSVSCTHAHARTHTCTHTHTQSDGVRVEYFVHLCESRYRTAWLAVLFGYKAIIQAIGVFLAFRIRKVKVSDNHITLCRHFSRVQIVIGTYIPWRYQQYCDPLLHQKTFDQH